MITEMNTKQENVLEQIHDEIDILALSPVDYGVYDDEDMIIFALCYLLANLDHAFEKLD